MPADIVGILLAAGSGSRFGGGKLLARLRDGTPVGLAAWKHLAAALPDSLAVVRKGDDAVAALFRDAGARVVECADAADGMSRSLIAGLQASAPCGGWVIALGDMPYVKPDTVSALASAIGRGKLIAVPAIGGARGNPVAFAAKLLPELLQVQGDEGARAVVKRHAQALCIVETRDPGILRDIDTPDDLVG